MVWFRTFLHLVYVVLIFVQYTHNVYTVSTKYEEREGRREGKPHTHAYIYSIVKVKWGKKWATICVWNAVLNLELLEVTLSKFCVIIL